MSKDGGYTSANDPYAQYNFKIEVDSIEVAGFNSATGMNMQMETVEYQEGGVNGYVHQLPGQFSQPNLVLEKGVTSSTKLWDWIQSVRSQGTKTKDARKNVTLKLQHEYKSDEMWAWEYQNAYPVRWEGPDFVGGGPSGGGEDVAVQTLELAHDGFKKLSGRP